MKCWKPGQIYTPSWCPCRAAGAALAAKTVKPEIRMIGLSMDRGAVMHASLAAVHPGDVQEIPSLADSLGGGIGLDNRYTFALCRHTAIATYALRESGDAGSLIRA